MGYQNNRRPRKLSELRLDIMFDLNDLWWDLVREDWKPSREKMIKQAEFVRDSMRKYVRGMDRKEAKK